MNNSPYCYKYPHPAVTTDCVIFGFDGAALSVLLIERSGEPFKSWWALPGGFLEPGETALECAARELQEETGLTGATLRQLHTFTQPGRDPREWVITIAHYALVPLQNVKGADDADCARWFAIDSLPPLAFDHSLIVARACNELCREIRFEAIGSDLLPQQLTIGELQNLCQAISAIKLPS